MYIFSFFFFNDTATTEIYTLSLHDALPICHPSALCVASAPAPLQSVTCALVCVPATTVHGRGVPLMPPLELVRSLTDRKSTRLNSSHANISYAVFCLKKKKKNTKPPSHRII